jgi:O-antigen/teichoic acid export membrane protein
MAFRAAGNLLIKNMIISTLKLLLPFTMIALGAYGIFASAALALAIGGLASIIILFFKFNIKPSFSINISLVKQMTKYSFANYITNFMYNMPSLILPVIILNTLSAKYAAFYYIVSMIQNILQYIPLAISQSLLTEGSYNETILKQHIKKAVAMISVTLFPTTIVIVLFGNIVLQFFGKNYSAEAFQFLQLYSISTMFTALLLVANAILNVKNKIKTLVISNTLVAGLTLGLSYAFIHGRFAGIGWGWTLWQAIAGLMSLYFIIRNYSNAPDLAGLQTRPRVKVAVAIQDK